MNKTKWILPAIVALTLGLIAVVGTGCGSKTEAPAKTAADVPVGKYYCTMDPEVVQDTPGKCPKCQMDLVVKK